MMLLQAINSLLRVSQIDHCGGIQALCHIDYLAENAKHHLTFGHIFNASVCLKEACSNDAVLKLDNSADVHPMKL